MNMKMNMGRPGDRGDRWEQEPDLGNSGGVARHEWEQDVGPGGRQEQEPDGGQEVEVDRSGGQVGGGGRQEVGGKKGARWPDRSVGPGGG